MRDRVRVRRSTRRLHLGVLTTLVLASAHLLIGASHGVIDTTFSSDGKTTVGFGDNLDDRARAVVVQPDGKIVVVGSIETGFADFAVARFNPDGSLDTTFSGDGKVSINFGGADFAQGVALQTDGKIVVVGYTNAGASGLNLNDVAVAKLTAGGVLDTTFHQDGLMTFNYGFDERATAVAIQDDGRIIVAGSRDATSSTKADFLVQRFKPDGSSDPFGPDDIIGFGTASVDSVTAVAIDTEGRIVVVGFSGPDMAVARLTAAGVLDTTFDGDGKLTMDFGGGEVATGVAIQADGQIVVVGASATGTTFASQALVMRLGTNGALDTSFSGDGKATVSFGGPLGDYPHGVALLHNGKIAVAGYASYVAGGDANMAVSMLTSEGTPDTTFGVNGRVTVDFGGQDVAYAIALQPDGAIVLAGYKAVAGIPPDFAVARIGADPPADVTFDADGRQETDFLLGSGEGRAVLVQPDGKTVVAGTGAGDVVMARYNTDGSLDPTFSSDGRQTVTFGGTDVAAAMVRQPDGRLIVVGYTSAGGGAGANDFAVIRLNTDGTLDTTFNDLASPTPSNGDGRLIVDFGSDDRAAGAAIQPDGKIVVIGRASSDFAILRLHADGTLDTTFQGSSGSLLTTPGAGRAVVGYLGAGLVPYAFDIATSVVIQPDGKIVVAGYTDVNGAAADFAVIRLTTNGALDTTFNDVPSPGGAFGDGRQVVSFGVSDDRAEAMVLQPDGKIVLAGVGAAAGGDFAVARLTPAGLLDTTFSGDGKMNLTFGAPTGVAREFATGVALQPDGKLIVAGYSDAGSGLGTNDFAIARITTNGSQDAGFANRGELLIDFGNDDRGYGVAIDPATSKAVVVGATSRGNSLAVVRLPADAGVPPPTLPSLSINDVSVQEGNAGTVNAVFTVTLSSASTSPVSVLAATSNGTASQPADYTAVSTGLIFLPGVTTQTVTVPVVGDVFDELNETFTVTLSGASGATIADGSGTGVISDDDLAVTITSPTSAPAFTATQALVTIGGAAGDPLVGGIQRVTWANAAGGSGTATGTTSWTAAIPLVVGANVVTVTALDLNGFTATDTVTVTLANFVSYLAEGATSSFLDTRLALLNPGVSDTTATLTFSRVGAAVVTHSLPVPAHTRVTLDAKAVPGLAAAEFSTKVESSQPLVVDRTMSWDATAYGAHAETAVAAPSPIWYLAEGATHSGFDLFYLLQNPAATPTTVRVRYLRPSGAPLEKNYVLPATSRTNIWVNTESFPGLGLALASTDVSAVIQSLDATPIIVERALYLTSQGRLFNAGHESAGVIAPALQWFLAEGSTGPYFDLFVLIANPNDTAADVRVTYLLTDGRTFTRTLRAPPNSRSNVWVDTETFDGGATFPLADVAVSTTVESENAVPIIVERALWWPGEFATWHEAHNSAGATQTGTVWALAEGEVAAAGSARGDETYILIANTSAFSGEARVTLYFEDGTTAVLMYPLSAKSRTNVAVGPDFGTLVRGKRFGAVVESLGATPAQIVVERAMYWNAGGVSWAAGTNALATRLQ